jgi:hypothetical protein
LEGGEDEIWSKLLGIGRDSCPEQILIPLDSYQGFSNSEEAIEFDEKIL